MTSPCAEPDRHAHYYRSSPHLLYRRLPTGMLVCVGANSVFQDVRVLRLDLAAAAIVDATLAPGARCTSSELAATAERAVGAPVEGLGDLVDGLTAARVLERVTP